jgi:hypothetical protein
MKATEFCYWLQGVFEVAEPVELTAKQTDMIKRHLNLVFIHDIDPSYPPEQQEALNEAHNGPKSNLPLYMQKGVTAAQLDAEYGVGVRPRC